MLMYHMYWYDVILLREYRFITLFVQIMNHFWTAYLHTRLAVNVALLNYIKSSIIYLNTQLD